MEAQTRFQMSDGAEDGRVCDTGLGKRRVVVDHAIQVAVTARHEIRATRRAEGIHDKRVSKTRALGGESIHVRRLKPRVAALVAVFALHDAHGIPALVVGVDEEKVGRARGGGAARERGEEEQRK